MLTSGTSTVAARRAVMAALMAAVMFAPLAAAQADQLCMDKANERLIRGCLSKAVVSSDDLLEKTIANANNGLDAQRSLKLHSSQDAWKLYRDAECAFEGDAYRGGTLEADQATNCYLSKNDERVHELGDDLGMAAH